MKTQRVHVLNIAWKTPRTSPYFKIMKLTYQILLIICCLDFGFFEHKSNKRRIFWKTFAMIQSTMLCCVCLFTLNNYGQLIITIWVAVYLVHYNLNVLVLVLMKPDRTISRFHFDLKLIDLKMRVDNASYNLEKRLLVMYFLDLSFRVTMCLVVCLTDNVCLEPAWTGAIYLVLVMSLDIVYITHTFVFYAINCRLKKLSCILEINDADINILQHIYKLILNSTMMYKSALDPLLIIGLLFTVPEVMASLYILVQELIQERNTITSLTYRMDYLLIIEALALTLAPAIWAGMLRTQADRIKIILHHKLMKERDETKKYEMERFIRYVEANSFQFRVCKVIPLDAELIRMVLGFCVTYLIVIIQFTNKY